MVDLAPRTQWGPAGACGERTTGEAGLFWSNFYVFQKIFSKLPDMEFSPIIRSSGSTVSAQISTAAINLKNFKLLSLLVKFFFSFL